MTLTVTPSVTPVVVLAALAAWFGVGVRATGQATYRRRPVRWWFVVASLGCLVSLGALAPIGPVQGSFGVRTALAACGTVGVALVVRRLVARRRNRKLREENQLAVVALCDALAGELRAGIPAATALDQACGQLPEWAPLLVSSRLGGDVAAGLRELAGRPGRRGLAAVAAAWEVSARSGLALADVLDRLSDVLRDEEDARSEVTAALAPARATAKLLAALPGFGLALGSSMGARPVHVLLSTPFGIGCLASGVVLALLGVLWVEHIADAAEC